MNEEFDFVTQRKRILYKVKQLNHVRVTANNYPLHLLIKIMYGYKFSHDGVDSGIPFALFDYE